MTASILTSGELDALRNAVDVDEPDHPGHGGGGGGRLGADGLPRFLFGQTRVAGAQREQRLSYVFDKACRALETRLSDVFETPCTATVTFLRVTRFSEFRESFELDVRELAMLGFRIAGLPGSGMVAVEPEVIERLVEGLMGGAASAELAQVGRKGFRSVTDLDVRVSQRIIDGFLQDLGRAWNPADPLETTITAADSSGVVARSFMDSTPVIACLLEVSTEEQLLGMLGVVMPRSSVDVLAAPGSADSQSALERRRSGPMVAQLPEFQVGVDVHVASKRITVRELLALQVGDVLAVDLRPTATGTVQGIPKFEGVPGVQNGRKAIRLVTVTGRDERDV